MRNTSYGLLIKVKSITPEFSANYSLKIKTYLNKKENTSLPQFEKSNFNT
jgi:hypothetical protein